MKVKTFISRLFKEGLVEGEENDKMSVDSFFAHLPDTTPITNLMFTGYPLSNALLA